MVCLSKIKAVFHKFHLVHSWILCPKYSLAQFLLQFNVVSPFSVAFIWRLHWLDTIKIWLSYRFIGTLLITTFKYLKLIAVSFTSWKGSSPKFTWSFSEFHRVNWRLFPLKSSENWRNSIFYENVLKTEW